MINNIEIKSIDQFLEIVKNKTDFIYRGQSNSNWNLESTLFRNFEQRRIIIHENNYLLGIDKVKNPIKELELENQIIEKFKRSAKLFSISLADNKNNLEWLSIMQHYGCPTRLIDFTHSPFVALYFACVSDISDFSIFIVSKNDISYLDGNTKSDEYFSLWNYSGTQEPMVYIFKSDEMNERQLNQQGLFLVPSSINFSFNDIINKNIKINNSITKLTFPARIRLSALKYLDKMNINANTLFPGISGFCKSLKDELY